MSTETQDRLQQHFASGVTYEIAGRTYRDILPRIICGDGTTMSIQVGSGMYCTPRDNDGPWGAAEVGYPSRKMDGLMEWAEDPDRPTDTVYGYVPIAALARVIDECGGLAGLAPKGGAA